MTTNVDFENILTQATAEIKAPPVLPNGIYRIRVNPVTPYELGEQPNEKKTKFCQVHFIVIAPYKVEDESALDGIEFGKRKISEKFWLTPDALFRLTEGLMQKSLGMKPEPGESVRESLQKLGEKECYALITATPGKRAGEFYNNISSYLALTDVAADGAVIE